MHLNRFGQDYLFALSYKVFSQVVSDLMIQTQIFFTAWLGNPTRSVKGCDL